MREPLGPEPCSFPRPGQAQLSTLSPLPLLGLAAGQPSSLQALDLMPQTLGPPPQSWDGEMKAKAPFLGISLELGPGRGILSSCPGEAQGPPQGQAQTM